MGNPPWSAQSAQSLTTGTGAGIDIVAALVIGVVVVVVVVVVAVVVVLVVVVVVAVVAGDGKKEKLIFPTTLPRVAGTIPICHRFKPNKRPEVVV